MLWSFLLACGLVIIGCGLIFQKQVKDKGLDPSLINYSNPLIRSGLWPLRVCLIAGLAFVPIIPVAGEFILNLVLAAVSVQLIILISFARLPTQPSLYYAIAAAAALDLLFWRRPAGLIAGIIIIIIQELYLALYWKNHNLSIYNKWVCRRALKLDKKYRRSFSPLPSKQRLAVLHVAATEDIARPAIVRVAERIYYRVKHPPVISSGIMQVAAPTPLSDKESIRRGAKMIKKALDTMPFETTDLHQQLLWLSKCYNGSQRYAAYLEATYPGVTAAWSKIIKD
jgi:hypothetical protein